MDDLSKQQLILVALLVSFVTSLATGIVTVSLMDQAPTDMTHTVSQVIEKTIQEIAPQDAATADASGTQSLADAISSAVGSVGASVVKFRSAGSATMSGIGLIVSKSGTMLADKLSLPDVSTSPHIEAVLADGKVVQVAVIQSQIDGDIAFLAPTEVSSSTAFVPITFSSSYSLGQEVFALSGTSTASLNPGLITETMPQSTSSLASFIPVKTSISAENLIPGSPLFDVHGNVIGFRTASLNGSVNGTEFLPVSVLKTVVPQ